MVARGGRGQAPWHIPVRAHRSTSRLTSGQRTALNDVERAEVDVRDGVQYYVYEHVSQVSRWGAARTWLDAEVEGLGPGALCQLARTREVVTARGWASAPPA